MKGEPKSTRHDCPFTVGQTVIHRDNTDYPFVVMESRWFESEDCWYLEVERDCASEHPELGGIYSYPASEFALKDA